MCFKETKDNDKGSKRPGDSVTNRSGTSSTPRNKKRRLEENGKNRCTPSPIPPNKIFIDLTEDDEQEKGLLEPPQRIDFTKSPSCIPPSPVGEAIRKIDRCFGSVRI